MAHGRSDLAHSPSDFPVFRFMEAITRLPCGVESSMNLQNLMCLSGM